MGESGQLEVFAKFYAWAHDEQGPIKEVSVSWGDFSAQTTIAGKLQNHKPRCQRSANENLGECKPTTVGGSDIPGYACDKTDECTHLSDVAVCPQKPQFRADRFGDTSGQDLADACIEGYFQFNHTYSCPTVAGLPVCDADLEKSNCAVTLNDGRSACRYRLGVQVQDNWEWCNSDNGGIGKHQGDCELTPIPYEYFDGFIYVIP